MESAYSMTGSATASAKGNRAHLSLNEGPGLFQPADGLLSPKKLSMMQLAQPRYDKIHQGADQNIGQYYDLRVRHARINASDALLTPQTNLDKGNKLPPMIPGNYSNTPKPARAGQAKQPVNHFKKQRFSAAHALPRAIARDQSNMIMEEPVQNQLESNGPKLAERSQRSRQRARMGVKSQVSRRNANQSSSMRGGQHSSILTQKSSQNNAPRKVQ